MTAVAMAVEYLASLEDAVASAGRSLSLVRMEACTYTDFI